MLLLLQPTLVMIGRTDVHRKVGVAGAVLAAAMVVLGLVGAATAAQRPGGFVGIPVPPLQFLIIPFGDIVLFGAFVALAIARRRDSQAHKRWMVLATVNLLTAAWARWPGTWYRIRCSSSGLRMRSSSRWPSGTSARVVGCTR